MATDKPVTVQTSSHVVHSLEETSLLAAKLLPKLIKSGVVSLEGPLGAGKTHFVKALACAMGITEEVTSPTFTLMNSYRTGELCLNHSDWYRLESEEEILALGLEDYYGEGLMIIEWGNKFPRLLPPSVIRIGIELLPDESRVFTCSSTIPQS